MPGSFTTSIKLSTERSDKRSGWGDALKAWRRNNRHRFNRLLARLIGSARSSSAPLDDSTRRILVVRLNKRLGNILFLTPMLRSLAATVPAAQIDVVIRDPAQVKLLESLPGIGRVWIQHTSVLGILRLLRAIRHEHYDLAIDPNGNSTSNRLAMAVSGARQRMGFARQDQWLPLTHASPKASSHHQALKPVQLLQSAISGRRVDIFDTLAVFPDSAACDAAEVHWQRAFGPGHDRRAPVIGFFARATGRKQLRRDWWQAWIAAVRARAPGAVLLEILPVAEAEPVSADIAHVAIRPLDELAATLAKLDVFVAADGGPMHLAAASGVPVVGLFQATSPSAYAPLGQNCLSIEGDALTIEHAVAAVNERLAPRRRPCAADHQD